MGDGMHFFKQVAAVSFMPRLGRGAVSDMVKNTLIMKITAMLMLAGFILLAPALAVPQKVLRKQVILPLPGSLNKTLVFNSNSPEVLKSEDGILLSTYPPEGKSYPDAHLNFPLSGRFDIFSHHIANAQEILPARTLYLAYLIQNASGKPVRVNVLAGASYLSQPDAPFIALPKELDNENANVYAGPGDRVAAEILCGRTQNIFPDKFELAPFETTLLLSKSIPVAGLVPPINGRSSLVQVRTSGPVYLASLAMFAPVDEGGQEKEPSMPEWITLLEKAKLASPRDKTPTPLTQKNMIVYGRVAGISQGNEWSGSPVNDEKSFGRLDIPAGGQCLSFPVASLRGGTLGTNQVQTASLLARYPDTACDANGNYGVKYSLELPLYNATDKEQVADLWFESPLKEEDTKEGLTFFEPPSANVFFRGTVKISYADPEKGAVERYVHLVLHRGEAEGQLDSLVLAPGQTRRVKVELIYPADCTPPQVLTIHTRSESDKE